MHTSDASHFINKEENTYNPRKNTSEENCKHASIFMTNIIRDEG